MLALVVQDVIAPFVLENLNCTGAEARLLDCPGVMEELTYDYYTNDPNYPYGRYTYIYGSVQFRRCDPLQGAYTFVACGMMEGPGGHTPTSITFHCTCSVYTMFDTQNV